MAAIKPSSLKVVELRQELSNRGLPTKGKKDELVARLTEALVAESDNKEEEEEEEEESTQEQQVVEEESQPAQSSTQVVSQIKEEVVEELTEKKEEITEEQPVEKQTESQTKEEQPPAETPVETLITTATVVATEKQTKTLDADPSLNTPVETSDKVTTDQFMVESEDAANDQLVDKKPAETNKDQTMKEANESSVNGNSIKEKEESTYAEVSGGKETMPTVDYSEETKDEVIMDEAESSADDKNLKRKASSIDEDKTEKKPRVEESDNEINSSAIYVKGFVRPLIIRQVQELFSEYGNIKRFWMDSIKTHCYVMYEKDSEAKEAFDNINGIVFPSDTGKSLTVGSLTPEQAEQLIGFEQSAAESRTRVDWEANIKKVKAGEELASTPTTTTDSRRSRSIGIGQIAKQLAQAATSTPAVTASRTPTSTQAQEQNESNLSLDDLFKKTEALPSLYYLPVSEEVAKARLAKLSK